jgi:hypothetical protein
VAAVEGLPNGNYTVVVQVIGGSYNSPVAGTPVGVGAVNALSQLMQYLLGLALDKGTQTALSVKVENASDAVSNGSIKVACNALRTFITEVNAQRGRKISTADADQLTSRAQQIRTLLRCD